MNTTTITITDPELLAKLAAAAEGQIVFRGPNGDTVKTVATGDLRRASAGDKITDLERRVRRSPEANGRQAPRGDSETAPSE
ncbi:MAG: hypothetical protein K2V38_08300 [Gemmataceae bacterium]|nr:hypothetical protein [Gemmataceae bacterium]